MKNTINSLLLIISVILVSNCTTVNYKYLLKTDCERLSPSELFSKMSPVLREEGMNITDVDTNRGYMSAEFFIIRLGLEYRAVWTFRVTGRQVVATAMTERKRENRIDYYDDNTDLDNRWYWNVRNQLALNCGNKITIEKIKE